MLAIRVVLARHRRAHRRLRELCVVHVGQSIGQDRAQVEQCCCRALCHARIAIGGAGDHSFEQAQDAPHLRLPVEGAHEMHFGGAWICKANIHLICKQGVAQTICAIHSDFLS